MRPVLYSFRRCPYAIRARLALQVSGAAYELREIHLRDKPAALLAASPKGSVPVLVLPDGEVIDESWDIMLWALRNRDPYGWLGAGDNTLIQASRLVEINDGAFKRALDRYKYADAASSRTPYRTQGEIFLQHLETRLQAHTCLLGASFSLADAAILPFVRQFAGVDAGWFEAAPYPRLRGWLRSGVESALFLSVMQKHPVWQPHAPPCLLPAQGSGLD